MPVVWVAAACASIAINGSRGLPQYFIQANPALALAAGWGGMLAWTWLRGATGQAARLIAVPVALVVIVAVWRVNQFDKLAEQTIFDTRYALGAMSREAYLARYDDDRKYSALAGDTLGKYLAAHSQPTDRVFVFGFTCARLRRSQARECLAVLLEPAGHRRLQRRPARIRRRGTALRPQRQSSDGHCSAIARLGARCR